MSTEEKSSVSSKEAVTDEPSLNPSSSKEEPSLSKVESVLKEKTNNESDSPPSLTQPQEPLNNNNKESNTQMDTPCVIAANKEVDAINSSQAQEAHSSNGSTSASSSPSSLVIIEESPNSNDSTSFSSCSSSAYSSLNSKSPRSVSPSLINEKKNNANKANDAENSKMKTSTQHDKVNESKNDKHSEEEDISSSAISSASSSSSSSSSSPSSSKRFKSEHSDQPMDSAEIATNDEHAPTETTKSLPDNETNNTNEAQLNDVESSPSSDSSISIVQEIDQPNSQLIETTAAAAIAAAVEAKANEDKYEAMQPRLKKFLKIYQQSSRNSLSGPSKSDDINLSSSDGVSSSLHSISKTSENSIEIGSNENDNLAIIANVAAAAATASTNDLRIINRMSSEER